MPTAKVVIDVVVERDANDENDLMLP